MIRLRPVIDRYSEAIEWDLLVLLGVDLLEFFRGERSWLQLGRFLRQLSHHPTSHFMVEQANDPEVARLIYAKKKEREKAGIPLGRYRPSPYEYDLHAFLLGRVLDRLGELEAVEASRPLPAKAKRLKPPKPFPAPATAMDQIEFEARLEYFESLDKDIDQAHARYRQEHGGEDQTTT